MKIEVLKSKIHGVTVTGADLNYIGSITIDEILMNASNIKIGMVVTILGSDGQTTISPQNWSDLSGSIPWEVLCSFRNRLPRVLT